MKKLLLIGTVVLLTATSAYAGPRRVVQLPSGSIAVDHGNGRASIYRNGKLTGTLVRRGNVFTGYRPNGTPLATFIRNGNGSTRLVATYGRSR